MSDFGQWFDSVVYPRLALWGVQTPSTRSKSNIAISGCFHFLLLDFGTDGIANLHRQPNSPVKSRMLGKWNVPASSIP